MKTPTNQSGITAKEVMRIMRRMIKQSPELANRPMGVLKGASAVGLRRVTNSSEWFDGPEFIIVGEA